MLTYTHHTLTCDTYVHEPTGSRERLAEKILVSRYRCIIISYFGILAFLTIMESACNDLNDLFKDRMVSIHTIITKYS